MRPAKTFTFFILIGLMTLLPATRALADFVPITLPTVNQDVRGLTGGSTYAPLYPTSSQTLGGVQFEFRTDASGNNSFVKGVLTISVNIPAVSSVYTLINSKFGSSGAQLGSVTFTGSGGLSSSFQLIEGFNVRDHYSGSYVNTTTDPNTTQNVFGSNSGAHFDMQRFDLPSTFQSATLTSIVFESIDKGYEGIPFLAGVTASVVPEPSTYIAGLLMLLPLGATAIKLIRKKNLV